MRRYLLPVALLIAAGVVLLATAAGQAGGVSTSSRSLYLIQFAGHPLATYGGGVAGFSATKPARGERINTHTANATNYSHYLENRQRVVLGSAGVSASNTVYHYTTAVNGAAAWLTQSEAAKLATTPGVLMVQKNTIQTIQTAPAGPAGQSAPVGSANAQTGSPQPPTPAFLGLTGKNGVWQTQFQGDKHAGQGIIIGDIDTGFWPENPSFAPLSEPRPDDVTIANKFHGTCDTSGEDPVTCNNKVLGARFYDSAGLSHANAGEFTSPRDYDGHGSHTASTAAGDPVEGTINGADVGPLEGMAPAARLSIYKVLYENAANTQAAGSTADIVAAVDQAIDDGVDVINFSVGDNVDSFGLEELAFLNAASAGVFVSAAAGNAGPGASTVDNAMPWEMTDAAGSFDQSFPKTVTLGDGETFTGVGRGVGVTSSPLIDSVDAGLSTADPTSVELCVSGTLDPAKVAGKIVLCLRGVNARIDKSLAVQEAGGAGMILYNASDAQEFDADFHFVPTAHINNTDGLAIKSYIHSTASPTASLSDTTVPTRVEAPVVAGFSSRGPSLFSGGDLLKPDIMAPGVDMVAAVSPQNHAGNLWDSESGTSMATPHIAGVAALLMSKHPNWTPMEVKSALMTTASPLDNDGKPISGTPFDFGAGEVDPGPAFDPGLVYNSGITDWLAYSCGVGVHLSTANGDVCDSIPAIQANQLNYPTIAAGSLPGSETITRTVTNVDNKPGDYTVQITKPTGFDVTVSPSEFKIKPGQSVSYSVTITRTTAPLNTYEFGQLVWTNNGPGNDHQQVRSPIAVKGVAIAAPPAVSETGATGTDPLSLPIGYTGTLTTNVQGMAQAVVTPRPLVEDDSAPFNPNAPATSAATTRIDTVVPAGTRLARFATFAEDYPAGADIDVFVYRVSGTSLIPAGSSAGSTATETVTRSNPTPATYAMFVNVFALPGGNGTPVTVQPNVFVVPSTDSGNLTATPTSQPVTTGTPATVTLGWSGLAPGRWLGLVNFGDGTSTIGTTQVSITSP
jgi:subtilisin family serine protease